MRSGSKTGSLACENQRAVKIGADEPCGCSATFGEAVWSPRFSVRGESIGDIVQVFNKAKGGNEYEARRSLVNPPQDKAELKISRRSCLKSR